jgi:hypothetical protein
MHPPSHLLLPLTRQPRHVQVCRWRHAPTKPPTAAANAPAKTRAGMQVEACTYKNTSKDTSQDTCRYVGGGMHPRHLPLPLTRQPRHVQVCRWRHAPQTPAAAANASAKTRAGMHPTSKDTSQDTCRHGGGGMHLQRQQQRHQPRHVQVCRWRHAPQTPAAAANAPAKTRAGM